MALAACALAILVSCCFWGCSMAQVESGTCRQRTAGKPSSAVETTSAVLLALLLPIWVIFMWKLEALTDYIAYIRINPDIEQLRQVTRDPLPDGVERFDDDALQVKQHYSASACGPVEFCQLMVDGSPVECLMKTLEDQEQEGKQSMAVSLFNREINALSKLKHDNIIKLLGVHDISHSHIRPPSQLLEHPGLGRLDVLLRDATFAAVASFKPHTCLVSQLSLNRFANDICKALEYCHQKDVTVKDIACRHCFVTSDFTVKLSVFELFVGSLEWEYKHPVGFRTYFGATRWMSPEMVAGTSAHTMASDMYMLAVALWEVFAKGEKPYASLTMEEVENSVKNGITLAQPRHCSGDMFALMQRCWSSSVVQRPTAGEVGDFVRTLVPEGDEGRPLPWSKDFARYAAGGADATDSSLAAGASHPNRVSWNDTVQVARNEGQVEHVGPGPFSIREEGRGDMDLAVRVSSSVPAPDSVSQRSDARLIPCSPVSRSPEPQTTAV